MNNALKRKAQRKRRLRTSSPFFLCPLRFLPRFIPIIPSDWAGCSPRIRRGLPHFISMHLRGKWRNRLVRCIAIAANMYFGASDSGTTGFLNGYLAECARWDRELSASEISSLQSGVSPRMFLNGLRWYVPMVRDYNEIKTGIAITNNSSTVSAHPRIIYPN